MKLHHDAFISYSHAADGVLAPAIEEGLEHLAKPLLKLRAINVFRDQTSLAASPALWKGIAARLEAAKWLLLFASPAAAASPWCQKEIEWWLEHRGVERLLIILTDGEIVWSADGRGMDTQKTTALPAFMARHLTDEPLYVDLRWTRNASSLTLRDARFREAVVSLAAPIRGMERDELDSADVRQLARNRRFVQAGFASIAVAAVLAIWQAKVATDQAEIANGQRVRAEQALAESERELLRAQGAELRGIAYRLDGLIDQARQTGDEVALQSLEVERRNLGERLARTVRLHQAKLAEQMGFRGDLDFLMRWEGNAGKVTLIGPSVFIDPATDLALAKVDDIRSRYEFILTPDELQALLATVGKRGEEARLAFEANPVLGRIRIAPADVARLVPEVIGPWWAQLKADHPIVGQTTTPAAVQTALLSFCLNMGTGKYFKQLAPFIEAGQWTQLADAIERTEYPRISPAIVANLMRRRNAEAALIRDALANSGLSSDRK